MVSRTLARTSAVAALLAASAAAAAPQPYENSIPVNTDDEKPMPVSDVDITYGGFVKMDAIASVYSDGDVATPGGLRDFYNPNSLPVAATSAAENEYSMLDMHAKETRLFFKIDGHVPTGKLGAYLEMDFLVNPGAGTEVVTNAYNPGLRRAYITYNNFLFGQDWSTFQNTGAFPDSLDFIRAPTEGTVFSRQPQIRYTLPAFLGGDWQFSLENSETTVRSVGGSTFVTGDGQLPDLVVRYNWKASFGEIDAAVLGRQLRADLAPTGDAAPNNVVSGTAGGYGISVSGKLNSFGKDDVRFMVTAGDGIGRYVALGAAPDSVADANGELETVKEIAGYVAYRHPWNERWRSSLMVGSLSIDNDTALMGTGVTDSVTSGRVNLLYSPVEKLTFGVEFTHAQKDLENGEDGRMDRVQLSAMYAY